MRGNYNTSCFNGMFIGFGVLLFLQGCKVGPDYVRPVVAMPDIWEQKAVRGLQAGQADLQTWWMVFDDSVLNELIKKAAKGNLDIQQAYLRIIQARANLGIATSEIYPQVDAVGSYSRQRFSDNSVFLLSGGDSQANVNLNELGVDSTWEIDVFGRIRRSIESASADLAASVEDWRDILVSLYADVAFNYVELRTFQKRIDFAESNVELQKQTLKLTEDLFNAGIVPQLDIRQAELNVATTQSAIPPLRFRVVETANRLAVLLGMWPGELNNMLLREKDIPKVPDNIMVGLPVELLRQRPDVRFAERVIASQSAQIGVAAADLYPIFSLRGTFAYEATQINQLMNESSRTYLYGPQFSWNIFDADRTVNNIRFQEALTEEACKNYENVILQALEEVDNSMSAFVQESDRKEALWRSVVAAEKSVDLVQTLYKTGLTDFQNVLDTQRSLFNQQDQFVESQGQLVQNLIEIYRSLGGGWQRRESLEGVTEADNDLQEVERCSMP